MHPRKMDGRAAQAIVSASYDKPQAPVNFLSARTSQVRSTVFQEYPSKSAHLDDETLLKKEKSRAAADIAGDELYAPVQARFTGQALE